MKKISLSSLLILLTLFVFSQKAEVFEVEEIAEKYLQSKLLKSDTTNFKLHKTSIVEFNEHASYYIVNFQPTGFVIISAYKFYEPILAYSTENIYQIYDMPENQKYWMQQYDFIIDSLYKHNFTNQQYIEKCRVCS